MQTGIPVETFQIIFMTLGATSAFALLISRQYATNTNKVYERSRWLLFALLVALTVHYLLQAIFHFRQQGDDVGTAFNLPFYSFATYTLALSILNMLEGKLRRVYVLTGLAFWLVITGGVIGGYLHCGSLHLPVGYLHILMAIYFVGLVLSVVVQLRKFYRIKRMLEGEYTVPVDYFINYVQTGAFLLFGTSIAIPLLLLQPLFMAIMGVIMMPLFFYLTICYVCVSFQMQGTMSALDEIYAEEAESDAIKDDLKTADNQSVTTFNDVQIKHIESAIAQWRSDRGFADSSLSLPLFAQSINIPKRQLSNYFSQHEGCTFRSWITRVRIEEAKKFMATHPSYSADAVVEHCGFSSRSFFQTAFKDQEDVTPKEWVKRGR